MYVVQWYATHKCMENRRQKSEEVWYCKKYLIQNSSAIKVFGPKKAIVKRCEIQCDSQEMTVMVD